eukprot:4346242-Prymnesium_polylepis.1
MTSGAPPCFFFEKGTCRNGAYCRFSHGLGGPPATPPGPQPLHQWGAPPRSPPAAALAAMARVAAAPTPAPPLGNSSSTGAPPAAGSGYLPHLDASPMVRRFASDTPYKELTYFQRENVDRLGVRTLRQVLEYLTRTGEAQRLSVRERAENPDALPGAVRRSDVVNWINRQGDGARTALWDIYNRTLASGRAKEGGLFMTRANGTVIPVWVAMELSQPNPGDEGAHVAVPRRAQSEAEAVHPSPGDQYTVSMLAAQAEEQSREQEK